MAFVRAVDGTTDPIEANDLNQVLDAWTGAPNRGVPLSLTAISDPIAFALTVRNVDATSGRALQVLSASGTVLLQVDRTGVVLSSDGVSAPSAPITAITPIKQLQQGTVAGRPAPGNPGHVYVATDVTPARVFVDNGAGWTETATLTGAQTLSGKTLTAPTISDFSAAQHTHSAAASGGLTRVAVRSVTAATTAADTDSVLLADATTAAFTVTLPTAVGRAGLSFDIKKTDASANAVTVDGAGAETIDGAATLTISGQNDSYSLISNGTYWVIV